MPSLYIWCNALSIQHGNSTIKQLINFYWHTERTHNQTKVKFAKQKQSREGRRRRERGKPASACNFSASRLTGSQNSNYTPGARSPPTRFIVCRNSINLWLGFSRIYLRDWDCRSLLKPSGITYRRQLERNEANSMAIHTPLSIAGSWL